MAASAIANIVKSSLGPVGLDKMLVDDIGVSAVNNVSLRIISMNVVTSCSFFREGCYCNQRRCYYFEITRS